LGYCAARDILGQDYTVINMVGDASFFNGENLEALISSDKKPRKMIIILNDNGMSISKNNNGLYKFISVCTTRKSYKRFMRFADKAVGWNFIGKALKKFKKFIKVGLNHTTAAESLGFKYLGIFDGHDIKDLVKILTNVKNSGDTVLLHLKTVKGKGLDDAQNNPSYYHGVGSQLINGVSTFSSSVSGIIPTWAAASAEAAAAGLQSIKRILTLAAARSAREAEATIKSSKSTCAAICCNIPANRSIYIYVTGVPIHTRVKRRNFSTHVSSGTLLINVGIFTVLALYCEKCLYNLAFAVTTAAAAAAALSNLPLKKGLLR
jgi:deoxyxylulose-5-phosphate synthase